MPTSMEVTPRVREVIFTSSTPLGSLSSWGVFALLQHFLVQQAAFLVGSRTWFSAYAILGDDLVIGHRKVAKQYRRLLKWMKVEISEEKSRSSVNGSMEFASRFIYRGTDMSPVSFRLLVAAKSASSQLASFFRRVEEFREIRISEFFRISGAGYQVMGRVGLPLCWRNYRNGGLDCGY